jgi:hypothetical protein
VCSILPEQGFLKPKQLGEFINTIVIKYMFANFKIIYLALNVVKSFRLPCNVEFILTEAI